MSKNKLVVKYPVELEDTSFDNLVEFLILNENNIAKKLGHWAFLEGVFKDLFNEDPEEVNNNVEENK